MHPPFARCQTPMGLLTLLQTPPEHRLPCAESCVVAIIVLYAGHVGAFFLAYALGCPLGFHANDPSAKSSSPPKSIHPSAVRSPSMLRTACHLMAPANHLHD